MSFKRATVAAAISSSFLTTLDMQIVSVALASLTRAFHCTEATSQWVITGYILSLAVAIPASGWLGDRFGNKRMYLIAMGVFTVASGFCAVSPSLAVLVAMRVLQGLGGGLLIPIGLTMMYRAHPPQERIRAQAVMMMVMVIGPAVAPLIGGVLLTELSWHWIFLVNIPFGAAAAVVAARYLREYKIDEPLPYDPAGLIFGGPGLALLLFAISSGPISGWGSLAVLIPAPLGCLLIGLFIRVELTRQHPMLELRLLASQRLFRQCAALQQFTAAAFYGSLVFVALYVQEVRGLSALTAGEVLFPEAFGVALASRVLLRLYPRVGPQRLVVLGFLMLMLGCVALARIGLGTSLWWVRLIAFELGAGNGTVNTALQTAAYAQVSERDTSHASAIYNTLLRAGLAVSVALLSTVLAVAGGTSLQLPIGALHAVFLAAACSAAVGFTFAWRLDDRAAAGTMSPPAARARSRRRSRDCPLDLTAS